MYDVLLAASAAFYLLMAAFFVRRPQAEFAHPATLYLAFHGFVFVLRPIAARVYDFQLVYRLFDFVPSPADKITAILAANLALAVFVGASLWLCRATPPRPVASELEAERARLAWPIGLACALIGPPAVWSMLENWGQRASNFDTMLRDAATGTLVNTERIGWFTDLGLACAPIAVMLVWLAGYRAWSWALFAGFAVMQAGTGVRGPLIYAGLALCLGYLVERGRRWPDWRAVLGALALGWAFNAIVIDRGGAVRSAFVGAERSRPVAAQTELAPLEHMDFAGLEYLEYVIYAVPRRTGTYDYFTSNLQILTEPIPRALWKNKPVGSPVQMFSLWAYGRPIGITLSVAGTGWMALGFAGVAIQAALFAWLFSHIHRTLRARRGNGAALIGYALLMATTVTALRDGAFLAMLRLLPFYLGPLVLALGIARLMEVGRGNTERPSGPVDAPLGLSPAERRRALAEQTAPGRPAQR